MSLWGGTTEGYLSERKFSYLDVAVNDSQNAITEYERQMQCVTPR